MWQRGPDIGIGLFLAAITLVAFGRVTENEFINFDDPHYVTEVFEVHSGLIERNVWWSWTTLHMGYWQPMTWMSLQLDAHIHGVDPAGFHRTNLALHLANVLLLFIVLKRLSGARWRSAMVAAFWAVHPLHVESVAWVTERKDVLATFFGLVGLGAYAEYVERPTRWRYAVILLAYALSLLAKPMLVTFPAVLLLLDWWPIGRLRLGQHAVARTDPPTPASQPQSLRCLLLEKLPFLLLAAIIGAITVYAQRQVGALASVERISWTDRSANALVSYVEYLRLTFWPIGLAVFYPHPRGAWSAGLVLGAACLLAGISVGTLVLGRRWPFLPVGWFWYVGTLLPVIGLLQAGAQAMADRFTYIPHIGLFLLLVWGGCELTMNRSAVRIALVMTAAVLLGACINLTSDQVLRWHDSETLWKHTLTVTARNDHAWFCLGQALLAKGQDAEAVAPFQEAVRIRPDQARYHMALARALSGCGRAAEAEGAHAEAMRLAAGPR